jgi:hypothetical protein
VVGAVSGLGRDTSSSAPTPASAPLPAAAVGVAGGLETAVVGISAGRTCGVHDHSALLADALGGAGVHSSEHWLWRQASSLRGSRSEIHAWTRALTTELASSRADAVLLHYSVFSYSFRGLPLFVPVTLSALRRSRLPLIPVMHELVFPWTLGRLPGKAWALSQRAVLLELVRASAAIVVTTDSRAEWLRSRPWLPRRPVRVAPVFSNLPPPTVGPPAGRALPVLGLFGYSDAGADSLVLDAVGLLAQRGVQVQLTLLGGPGRASAAGEAWLAAAASRGLERSLSFSGVLPAQALSNALAGCEVLLFVDPAGPTSRKGTLAGSLASGSAVVAVDGPQRWAELARSQAVEVVAASARALADAVAGLLAEEDRRLALGARGRAFAEREIAVVRSASTVRELLDEVLAGQGSG